MQTSSKITKLNFGKENGKDVIHKFIEISVTEEEVDELLKLNSFIMPYDSIYMRLRMKKGDIGLIYVEKCEGKDFKELTFLRFILKVKK